MKQRFRFNGHRQYSRNRKIGVRYAIYLIVLSFLTFFIFYKNKGQVDQPQVLDELEMHSIEIEDEMLF
jgi:hypothetical protein